MDPPKKDNPQAPSKPIVKPPAVAREARLAAALRANLRRRKTPGKIRAPKT
jgi:hypothetical protein